jgi:two-component system chemotaxis response regulator CheB
MPKGGTMSQEGMVRQTSLVVIGASAGGVESLRRVVGNLPADLPAAVAVVLHLSPTSKSMLAAILTRSGPLPAHQAVDGEAVTPGRIVVAAPDHHLTVEDHVYRVMRGAAENSVRPAIDRLFRTAAQVYGRRVVGVVLSGSLDDGTAGLFEIKRRGGWTMVQDPREALYPDMPQSAIDHVTIDVVADSSSLGEQITSAVRPGSAAPRRHRSPPTAVTLLGPPSGMSCPDCSGQLWEIEGSEPLRYRCRVGHEWTGKALVEGQERALENALWASLRIIGERVQLTRRMLDRAVQRRQHHIVQLLETRLAELADEEVLLRRTLDGPVSAIPAGLDRTVDDESR